jgi:hypothetical protein
MFALVLALLLLVLLCLVALGADPSASPTAAAVASGDSRSEGAGPGLVGNPVLVLMAVIGLGLITAAITAVLVRLTSRRTR